MRYQDVLLQVMNMRSPFEGKLVKPNTRMYKSSGDDSIAVRLYDTVIVRFNVDGSIRLNSGGWRTMTTLKRMNAFLPNTVQVICRKGVWSVKTINGLIDFQDGMDIARGDVS